ncbi:uncharacterized protein LOC107045584 [Diachasma alloeum]|uniref:uncharacterized protein LOC107045584 n=1 Tax=Diachasma alloeum TaxID=454923 RepID=UPI00073833F1|nr:uncharacterized protein LOC107045584 [Diachasma alloeum]
MAGRAWFNGFMKRNSELSLRIPEGVSSARAMALNKVVVQSFYDLLLEQYEKYHFAHDRIYNMDETGVTGIPKTLSQVVALKGKRQVGKKTSGERSKTVSAILCVSASGNALPPRFIFPRARMDPKLMNGALPGARGMATDSGWSTIEAFFEWFKWFVDTVEPTQEKPVLLLLDGHYSHVKNLEVIEYVRAHNTVILCFPPHCTHRLQPLDVSVMKPVSIYYADEISERERKDPGRNTVLGDIPFLFGRADVKAARSSVIVNGFKATGIYPFNPQRFIDPDFAPSKVTNRSAPQSDRSGESSMTGSAPGGISEEEATTKSSSHSVDTSPPHYTLSDSDPDLDVQQTERAEHPPDPPLKRSNRQARTRITPDIDTEADGESESSRPEPKIRTSKYRKLHLRKTEGFKVNSQDIMPMPVAHDEPT